MAYRELLLEEPGNCLLDCVKKSCVTRQCLLPGRSTIVSPTHLSGAICTSVNGSPGVRLVTVILGNVKVA